MLHLVAARFDGDHWGEKLGLAYRDDFMGNLLVSPNVLRLEDGRVTLAVNMRRPRGMDAKTFGARLDATLATLERDIDPKLTEPEERYVGEPHMADLSGPLVPTLLAIYRRHSGDEAAEAKAIRGGTYARLFPGAVDFGPSLPNRPYRGHAPDEYMEIEALRLTTRVLFDAVLELDAAAQP
jgi:dipeptidase D